ncbi:MAG: heme ABC transporter permease, partial [Stenotrophomonas sp.]
MNPIVRWFHQLGSPPTFDRFAARWSRVFYAAAVPVLLIGLWQGLFVAPPEQNQHDAFRIIYI